MAHLSKVLLTCTSLGFSACTSLPVPVEKPQVLDIQPTDYHHIPGWNRHVPESAMEAFLRTCPRFLAMHPYDDVAFTGKAGKWQGVCQRALELRTRMTGMPEASRYYGDFFEREFTPLLASNHGDTKGMFTGYYEPELRGSLVKTNRYRYPVYRKPTFLRKPYLTRKQIENGALAKKKLEIAYVDDAVELFFLQIQGSGRIKLPDGEILRVGYSDQNGQKYYAIGRWLVDNGYYTKEQVTAPLIKEWLHNHPNEREGIMQMNPSYVFFRVLQGPDNGPIGAAGIPLVNGYSLAVDRKFIPMGLPVWLTTTFPDAAATPLDRLMVAQDTGGAIKGPVRGDVFFGPGEQAEWLAGHMKQEGRYYLLVPR